MTSAGNVHCTQGAPEKKPHTVCVLSCRVVYTREFTVLLVGFVYLSFKHNEQAQVGPVGNMSRRYNAFCSTLSLLFAGRSFSNQAHHTEVDEAVSSQPLVSGQLFDGVVQCLEGL